MNNIGRTMMFVAASLLMLFFVVGLTVPGCCVPGPADEIEQPYLP